MSIMITVSTWAVVIVAICRTMVTVVGHVVEIARNVAALRRELGLGGDLLTCIYAQRTTDLAVIIAGRKRGSSLREEWRRHLAGDEGRRLLPQERLCAASGFAVAAVRYRLRDASVLAWRPADAVLSSRFLSNLFVWGPVIVALVAIVHHDSRFGLLADDQDPVALGAFLYVVIKTGCWWRGIKPPEPKARRAKE